MDFVDVSLQVARGAVGADFASVVCGRCGAPLGFHQPEARTPQRILATCEDCGAWYLLDVSRGWMLLLPEGELEPSSPSCSAPPESQVVGT